MREMYAAVTERHRTLNQQGTLDMAKGEQRNDKANKKPKKDSSPAKESSSVSTRPVAPTTAVMPKGKLKNKPG